MTYQRQFIVGNTYLTQEGKSVKIVADNVGKLPQSYRCVQGDDGGWRYDREGDVGRVTASNFDMSDPRNLVAGSKQ